MKNLGAFLPLILIVLVFWFLVIRPQRRRQQDLSSTQRGITVGTEVMLGSGIYGTIRAIDDDTVRVEVAPGTTMKVSRQAVVRVVDQTHDQTPDMAPDQPGEEPLKPQGPQDQRDQQDQ